MEEYGVSVNATPSIPGHEVQPARRSTLAAAERQSQHCFATSAGWYKEFITYICRALARKPCHENSPLQRLGDQDSLQLVPVAG